jgi:hypothetical protein
MSAQDDIHIADLNDPILTPVQQAARDGAEQFPVDLSEAGVLGEAAERTGLSDFGAEDFRQRLGVQLESVNEDEGLGAVGRISVYRDLVRYAANRLRFEDLLKRHPEILDVEVRAPIIIGGLPRSGTTHLLNLIAADTRLRSLPYWESLEPVPDAGEAPGEGGADPRLVRCQEGYAQQLAMMPLLKNMHDMAPDHIHEEIELQGLDFSSYLLEWIATVPRWRDYYLAQDQTPHYAYMKRVLQALQWMRGPSRWVLKSPQHLEQLGPLRSIFPDATVVLTHRDPISVVASAATMLAYGDRVRRKRADPPAVAAYWADRVETLLRACVRDRDQVPADQSVDVLFHEFMADDVGTVEGIYDVANLEMTSSARAALDAFMAANPRGKHGRIVYDLKGDLGFDPAALRERFAFYFDRFPIREEAH